MTSVAHRSHLSNGNNDSDFTSVGNIGLFLETNRGLSLQYLTRSILMCLHFLDIWRRKLGRGADKKIRIWYLPEMTPIRFSLG
jgi:hypothetical protein